MAKTHSSTRSSDGGASRTVTTSNRLGSRSVTDSFRPTRNGYVHLHSESSTSNSGSVFVIFKIVAILIIVLSLFSLLFGHEQFFGFKTLLDALSSVPVGDLSNLTDTVQIPTITSDWGVVLNGVRDFFNVTIGMFNTVISFVIFVGVGFVQLIGLLRHFILLI